MIATVANGLDEGFVPLRVSVVGIEAGDPGAFLRHGIAEIRDLPEVRLCRHEHLALDRAAAKQRTRSVGRELRAGFEIGSGSVLTARVVGDIKRAAGEEFVAAVDPGAAVRGMQRLFDIFWKLKRCPVVIVEDTDHWGGSPETADAFFDQTARTLGTMDAVTVVAAQTDYTRLDGYLRIRDKLSSEIVLPRLPDVEVGLGRVLTHRMESAGVGATTGEIFAPDAVRLLAHAYSESACENQAGDLRRTLAVVRAALEAALSEPTAEAIGAGHVREAIAGMPLAPASALAG